MKKKSAAPVAKPAKRVGAGSKYLDQLVIQIRAFRHPLPEREVLFHPTRKWRMDLAWPDLKVAVEYQGGIFSRQASHSSAANIMRDQEKANEAQLHGWLLIYANAKTVSTGQAVDWVNRALALRRKDSNE